MSVEHVLMFILIAFVFYHFMCRCDRVEGLSSECDNNLQMHRIENNSLEDRSLCIEIEGPEKYINEMINYPGFKEGKCPREYKTIDTPSRPIPFEKCGSDCCFSTVYSDAIPNREFCWYDNQCESGKCQKHQWTDSSSFECKTYFGSVHPSDNNMCVPDTEKCKRLTYDCITKKNQGNPPIEHDIITKCIT